MAPRQCCSSLIAFLLVIIVPTTQCFSLYDIGYRLEQDLQAEVHNFFDRQMVAEEPDVHMTTDQMIRMRGYQSESHFVTTDDCYVLHLFRIVVPPSAGRFHSASKYRPVIIQHGLLGSSVDFVLNTVGGSLSDQDNHNLAFVLARNGFDVWLSNVRGNRYSRNHTKYNPDQNPEFWKFSFDQHALNDLPAVIGYVQNQTQSREVSYIGYSQGTLTMFELLSEREPINRIVKPFIALAPVATIGYTKSPIKYIGYDSWLVNSFLRHPGQYLNEGHLNELLAELFCRGPDKYLCENLIFLLVGYDSVQMNLTRLPVYISHLPAGTSKWNLVHYAQSVRSGQLQKLDLGTEINQRCYYQSTAPKFFLDQITNQHIHLFHSDNDWLADSRDFEYLIQNLKVNVFNYRIPFAKWNHLDFMVAKQSDTLLNPQILAALQQYADDPVDSDVPLLPLYNGATCLEQKCF